MPFLTDWFSINLSKNPSVHWVQRVPEHPLTINAEAVPVPLLGACSVPHTVLQPATALVILGVSFRQRPPSATHKSILSELF